jgi:NNP family nitrate/nitrite transporter-like MFS transporter
MRAATPHLAFVAVMVFLSMYSRVVISPLLVFVQEDLAIGPAQATRLFLPLSITYSVAMLASGFIAERIRHRPTISVSAAFLGLGMILLGAGQTVPMLYVAFSVIGIGAGLYPPSGVATVTALVEEKIRGRAIAIHELGPNMAFVVAPLVVAGVVAFANWRVVPIASGAFAILMAILFGRYSIAGDFAGERPHLENIRRIVVQPEFWAITVFFSIAASSTLGVFAILPTFLISVEGYPVGDVNAILSISRMSGIVMVFLSGVLVDRFGVRRLVLVVLALTSVLTVGIGVLHGTPMLVAVFLQPIIITAFFPAAIAATADLGPPAVRNVAVSVMIPTVNIISSGIFPSLMGVLTERGSVRAGFIGLGVVMFLSLVMLPMLRESRS